MYFIGVKNTNIAMIGSYTTIAKAQVVADDLNTRYNTDKYEVIEIETPDSVANPT